MGPVLQDARISAAVSTVMVKVNLDVAMDFADRQRRPRWPFVLGVIGGLGLAFLGVAGGAARTTADATAQAAQLRAHRNFGAAIALYTQIAGRNSAIFVLDRGDVSAAPREAQSTMLQWAAALAAAGHVDQAVALAGSVTDRKLLPSAQMERATLLIAAARQAAAGGDFAGALLRLNELEKLDSTSPVASQAAALLPQYDAGEANLLAAQGRGSDAVTLLDQAADLGASARPVVDAALPAALLAAGREQINDQSYIEAAATLQRLVSSYPSSAQADAARRLLGQREPVAGTLTDKTGSPISGAVRLSSNFQSLPGGYVTSGPFYYSAADGNGDFRFNAIPVGGPYVLEVFHNGNWTTLIDPSTGRPANPVNVTAMNPVDLNFIVLPS